MVYTRGMTEDNTRLAKPVAYGTLVACLLIVIILSLQIWVQFITFDYYPWVLLFTYVSNGLVLPVLLLLATKSARFLMPTLVWLHFSMGVALLYFSQIYSPFTVTWATLILLSSIYYSWRGFWLSSAGLIVLTLCYISMFPENLLQEGGLITYSLLSALVVSLTILTSYMFVVVIKNAQKKNNEMRQARRSEMLQMNRLNTLLNSISDAVLTLNRYGRVTSQNAAAQAFFDTNQSLIGKDIDRLLHFKNEADSKVRVHDLMSEVKSTLHRDDLTTLNGEELRHVSLQMSRIRGTFDDDEEYGVVLILRDITKQKTLEEEKDEFISVTSHELRTPVAIAEGSISNLLVMHDRQADSDSLRAATETAYDQIIYLAKIVNDLSTLSRAERGVGDTAEEIDVTDLIHDMHGRYQKEARDKGLRLDIDVRASLPKIMASRLYLEEVLQNLLTNSIKYTHEGSVTLRAQLLDDGRIECSVKDTGIGISKSDLDKIFQKFYRSEDYRTRETNGTGLGLYVVEKLAAKLGTEIKVESRLNHGSTFRFVLPLENTESKN